MALVEGAGKPRLLPVSAIDYVSGYLMAFGAMTALLRRARDGGSWRVRVSLARTGQWIVERGSARCSGNRRPPARVTRRGDRRLE